MSVSAAAQATAIARGAPAASAFSRSTRVAVYAACTVAALVANYLLGKDLPWDTINYHFYAGFSALHDRFSQDYFAAGPPSYFNPYAFVPFYALVSAGLSPLAISSLLVAAQSIIFLLTFELALCICPLEARSARTAFGLSAVAVTFLNPILMQQLGSSFADITTAELVLGGWLLLAQSIRTPQTAKIVFAGLLLGTATALKLTNSVHAIAAFAFFIMLPRTWTARIRCGIVLAAAVGMGFIVVSAPWSIRLERTFGNPFFPLMNSAFRSPEFTTEPLRHFRFIPESFLSALWRPFAIANPVPMVQEELTAPDLRYAVLVVLAAAVLVRWVLQRRARSSSPPSGATSRDTRRILAALGCGLAVDWVLWLSASGNGRYFLPMASVAAVVVVALVYHLFSARIKVRNYVLFALLGLQLVQLCFGANCRWNSAAWDRRWLTVEVPPKLRERNLYLTAGIQSNSFIAPYLAADSGLINFSGGYALEPDGAAGARIAALLKHYAPHVRVLWRDDGELHGRDASPVDDALSDFGLRVDSSDCATIAVKGLPAEPQTRFVVSGPIQPSVASQPSDTSYLKSCLLIPDDGADLTGQIAREREVNAVLDRVEDACPSLLQPRRLRTEQYHEMWHRLYVNTDLVILISHGTVKLLNPVRGGPMIYLGLESDWAKAPMRLSCGRRNGVYFADVLPSKAE